MNRKSSAYPWIILALLACSQMIAYIDRINLAVVGPQLIKTYGYTKGEVGLLLSVFNWSYTLSILGAGPLVDYIKPKRAYPLGVGLWSLATALCSLTQSFLPLTSFLVLLGIGESTVTPSGGRVIHQTFSKKDRAFAVGTFFAGNKVGLTLGFLLSSVLYAKYGWPAVFLVTGGMGFVWVVVWVSVYRAPPTDEKAVQAGKASTIRWATLLRYRTTWGMMLGQAGYLYIYYVFATWLPGYLALQRGMSVLQTGIVGMLPFLVGTICVVLGGYLGDRLIASGVRVTVARKLFAVGGLLGATIFTILGAYSDDTVVAVSFLTLSVGSFCFSTASVNSMPIDVAPPHMVSSLVSLQNVVGNLGGAFAPLVTGYLVSTSNDFTLPLLVAAGVALVLGCGGYGLIVGDLDHELKPIDARRSSGTIAQASSAAE